MRRFILIIFSCSFFQASFAQDLSWWAQEKTDTVDAGRHAFFIHNNIGKVMTWTWPADTSGTNIRLSTGQVMRGKIHTDYCYVYEWGEKAVKIDSVPRPTFVLGNIFNVDGYFYLYGIKRRPPGNTIPDNVFGEQIIIPNGIVFLKLNPDFSFNRIDTIPSSHPFNFHSPPSLHYREDVDSFYAYQQFHTSDLMEFTIREDTFKKLDLGYTELVFQFGFHSDFSGADYKFIEKDGWIQMRANNFSNHNPLTRKTIDFYNKQTANREFFEVGRPSRRIEGPASYLIDLLETEDPKEKIAIIQGYPGDSFRWNGDWLKLAPSSNLSVLRVQNMKATEVLLSLNAKRPGKAYLHAKNGYKQLIFSTEGDVYMEGEILFQAPKIPGFIKQYIAVTLNENWTPLAISQGPFSCTSNPMYDIMVNEKKRLVYLATGLHARSVKQLQETGCENLSAFLFEIPFFGQPRKSFELFVTDTTCSTVDLRWYGSDADHYTLLVSSDSKLSTYPRDGENYNYSPNYLLAQRLDQETRVLYQGKDTIASVFNLPSGRNYWFHVVAGNGPAGLTNYNTDSITQTSIKLAKSKEEFVLKDSLSRLINLCKGDTAEVSMEVKRFIRWEDGVTKRHRQFTKSVKLEVLAYDSMGCVVSDYCIIKEIKSPIILELQVDPSQPRRIDSFSYPDTIFSCSDTLSITPDYVQDHFQWDLVFGSDTIDVLRDTILSIRKNDLYGCWGERDIVIQFVQPEIQIDSDTLFYTDAGIESPEYRGICDSIEWIDANGNDLVFPYFPKRDAYIYANCILKQKRYRRFPDIEIECAYFSDSIFLKRKPEYLLQLPNAFTPNNDGLNDVWSPMVRDSYTYSIYDRWGEKIFEGDQEIGWDGRKNGELLPSGHYYYFLFQEGKNATKGLIHLIR